ncbi:MAG: hypothetical protein H7124_09360 [Phycisphaerales bacterium]|nr:hypothetical protein [Hyphomonadaceae bacterium]
MKEEAASASTHWRLRLMLASFRGASESAMAQRRPTPLQEVEAAPVDDAKVIDAQFKIVSARTGKRRIFWSALIAIFWAALVGFLIPPAWIVFQSIGEYFAAP